MPVTSKCLYITFCLHPNICNFESTTLSRIRHVVGGSMSLLSCQQAYELNARTVTSEVFQYPNVHMISEMNVLYFNRNAKYTRIFYFVNFNCLNYEKSTQRAYIY